MKKCIPDRIGMSQAKTLSFVKTLTTKYIWNIYLYVDFLNASSEFWGQRIVKVSTWRFHSTFKCSNRAALWDHRPAWTNEPIIKKNMNRNQFKYQAWNNHRYNEWSSIWIFSTWSLHRAETASRHWVFKTRNLHRK